MISVDHLTKYYGAKPAIQDVSFNVKKGEILGFLGPNAAGKTTTMRILTCYMPATEGTATVGGFDVFKDSLEVRKRIGYLPENPPLYTDMTAKGFLEFVAQIKGIERREIKNRLSEVMEKAAITEVANRLIKHLSKGYKQRVGIAQALIHNPEILILDEPTVGLDPKQIIEVREMIKNLGGEHTIILSTHILPEVSMTCERVIIINEGKIVASDTPDNLTKRLKGSESLFVEVEGPRKEIEAKIKSMKGITRVTFQRKTNQNVVGFRVETELHTDLRKELATLVVQQGWGLMELRPMGMSLEEIFLHLTTKEEEVSGA
ncbi:ATP-binding cassette domain-containing protein [bacterium]|nr:ATP-binding cassette domain-containing protein [bacterium]